MADEAVCIETPTKFARYTVADGTGIAIGTVLTVTDPNTAIIASDNESFAGIAWEEKTASDGITEIVAALNGVWDMTDDGTGITAGKLVITSGANEIKAAVEASMPEGRLIGKALETAGSNEVIRVRVNAQ